jgi:hypothetical protein
MKESGVSRNLEIGLLAGLVAVACDGDRREPQEWGTLELVWTIDQQATPGACAPSGADSLEVTLLNRGMVDSRYTVACEAFTFTADPVLATDSYTLQLRLLDANNVANGPSIVSPTFSVQANTPTFIRANFGAENQVEVTPDLGPTDAAATP